MQRDQVLKVVVAIVVVIAIYMLAKRMYKKDVSTASPGTKSSYVPFDEMPFETVPPAENKLPQQSLNIATNLLPKPASPQVMDFGEFAPKALAGQNFLEVAQQLGVDTQGSSMRNANYQIRSDPPNPRTNVGPWANSTIESDLLRRPLE
jgi:hypothetical protein